MRKPATACLKSNLHVIRTISMTHRGNSIRASSCSWPAPRFSPRSPSFGHGAWRRASCNICSDLDLSLDSLVFDACLNGHYSRSGRTELPGTVEGDEEDADRISYKFFFSVDHHRMSRYMGCMKGICASISTLSFQADVVLIHNVSCSLYRIIFSSI